MRKFGLHDALLWFQKGRRVSVFGVQERADRDLVQRNGFGLLPKLELKV